MNWKTNRNLLLGLYLVTFVSHRALGDPTMPSVEVTSSVEGAIKPNTTVVITCKLTNFQAADLVNFVKKVFIAPPHTDAEEVVSQSSVLTEIYQRRNRFSIEKHHDGTAIIYKLYINDAQYEDSAAYVCKAHHEQHGWQEAYTSIEVYRKPMFEGSSNESHVIRVTEEETIIFNCTAYQAMPIWDLSVWIDDPPVVEHHKKPGNRFGELRNKTDDSWRDVTKLFVTSTNTVPHCNEIAGQDKNCLLHQDYNLTAISREFKARPLFDSRNLTCVARSRWFNNEVVKTSYRMDILHKPLIICEGAILGIITAEGNQSNFKIECYVRANPPTSEKKGAWFLGTCHNENSAPIMPGDEYNLEQEVDISNDMKSYATVLTIKGVLAAKYFGQPYCIKATNSMGTTEHQIQLRQKLFENNEGAILRMTSYNLMLFLAAMVFVYFA